MKLYYMMKDLFELPNKKKKYSEKENYITLLKWGLSK